MKKWLLLVGILILILLASASGYPKADRAAAQVGQTVTLEGTFTILWGDGAPGTGLSQVLYFLDTAQGAPIRLFLDEQFLAQQDGVLAWNRQPLTVSGEWLGAPGGTLQVHEIDASAARAPQGVFGSHPWVSVMCKFSDVSAEPKDLNYFLGMYSPAFPGLDHYWRQQSYDQVDLLGSSAHGWYVLPKPRSAYFDSNGNLLHSLAAQDCTAVGDPYIYYPNYDGINLMFNDVLDCCAWGGAMTLTLDGVTRTWRMTWEPPWGYENIGVLAHETGHGFGLPHSSGDYGEVYDNQWDVMSGVWYAADYGGTDATFGSLMQGTISYHKTILEWIPADRILVVDVGESATVMLEQLTLPQTTNPLSIQVLINGSTSHYYTIEARNRVGYDTYLPGSAVVIHEVEEGRSEPAHVLDVDDNGDTGDAGAMWLAGETYTDTVNEIVISVLDQTASGYEVLVENTIRPVEELAIDGSDIGATGYVYTFTAEVSPLDAALPITYVWQVDEQTTITNVVMDLEDAVSFTWGAPGVKNIQVTAANIHRQASGAFSIRLTDSIPLQAVTLAGPLEGLQHNPYTFTVSALPITLTQPLTYIWQATGQPSLVHTTGLSDSVAFTWDEPGSKQVSVSVENVSGRARVVQSIKIFAPPQALRLDGLPYSPVGEEYTLLISVEPPTTTLPLTCVIQTAEQETITQTLNALSFSQTFIWDSPGTRMITVTVGNLAGSVQALNPVEVGILPQGVEISAPPGRAGVGEPLTFIAVVTPLLTTPPITYTWFVDDAWAATHLGGLSDSFTVTLSEPGAHSIRVEASAMDIVLSDIWVVDLHYLLRLPLVLRY